MSRSYSMDGSEDTSNFAVAGPLPNLWVGPYNATALQLPHDTTQRWQK